MVSFANLFGRGPATCMDINSRVKYVGNYTAHECEIEVSNVSSDDSGVWTCDVESYVLGAGSGYKAKKELTLTVKSTGKIFFLQFC